MSVYKIIFARNEVISCKEIKDDVELEGTYQYEHIHGRLIYALIKADTETDARDIADVIVKKVESEVFGNDFVY